MESLIKLFGSVAKVKIMKLFLANPEKVFDNNDIFERTKVPVSSGRREISILNKAGLIRKKIFFKEIPQKDLKEKITTKKIKMNGWVINNKSSLVVPLQNLLVNVRPLAPNDIVRKFSGVGKLKLVIVAGIFIQESDSRVDLLIVGDNLKKSALDKVVSVLESEIGKELVYTTFETEDFKYRLGVYDKLIRDILDYPHQTLVDKVGVEPKSF